METSLHRALKQLYAGDDAQTEVRLGRYRVDAVVGDLLIEVQHGTLSALRDKVRKLVENHDVLIVKPIIARKLLVSFSKRGGRIVSRRQSPRRGTLLDLFHELVYFTRVFPHPRLTIEAVLVDVEEHRHPGHGRRRRWRRRDHVVIDQHLVSVGQTLRLGSAADLSQLLPAPLRPTFHTGDLAADQGVPRWVAQRIAYVLRETKAIETIGKQRNAICYRPVKPSKRRAA